MISDTKKTVFVPHHLTVVGELGSEISNAVEQALDIEIVSPREDFRVVIDSIRSAELVLTESLHGAIIADAFRIPWRAVALSPMFNWFKWRDWSYSVEIEPEIYAAFGTTNLASRWLGKLKRRVNFPRNLDLDWRKDRLLSRNQVCDEIVRVLQTAMRASPQLSPQWAVEARMDDFEKAIREFRHRYNG
ncbi:MAG: polysaccharide pyruvyl transferase family protein [Roseinatronobacter sp.]